MLPLASVAVATMLVANPYPSAQAVSPAPDGGEARAASFDGIQAPERVETEPSQPRGEEETQESNVVQEDPIRTTLGVGGQVGGFTFGVGVSARYWWSEELGIELALSRSSTSLSSVIGPGTSSASLSHLQVAPSLLYRLTTVEKTSVVFVPYAGGGVNIMRSSLSAEASLGDVVIEDSASETDLGFQGFVGTDVRFRSLPAFGVSGDIGYYSTATPFLGLDIGGFALAMAGHYYFK